MPERLVTDDFREKAMEGDAKVSEYVCGSPYEMETILDYTGLRGSGSNIYHSVIYQLPRWAFNVKKVDEWIEVNPAYAEFYNITIAQKQKLEASIKTGLTSAAQAVADYELLEHDSRRYREILDYFRQGQTDEHVLRSLFVDRVDAFTGEGYSLVTMARRWPTIITDFIRMKTEMTDVKEIMNKLDVSQAEATVLKTKNELYKEWKTLFFPTVKDRYARIENMVRARKKSVDEYKNWLKPYVSQYKRIQEVGEKEPSYFLSDATITPGFGQSQALTGVRIWAWKPFVVGEKGRPEKVIEKFRKTDFVIDPYDEVVKEWMPKIEEKYRIDVVGIVKEMKIKPKKGVNLNDKDVARNIIVRNLLSEAIKQGPHSYVKQMDPNELYYILVDMYVWLSLLRTPPPEGLEIDNLMFIPIKAWVMSQNALLLHLLEIWARERALENYIDELLGVGKLEEKIRANVEEEFQQKKPEKGKLFGKKSNKVGGIVKGGSEKVFYTFVKKGPYEPIFEERVSKMYMRNAGPIYGQVVNLIRAKMGVG